MANPKPSPSQRTSSTSRAAGRHLWFADLVHALTPKPRFAMLQVPGAHDEDRPDPGNIAAEASNRALPMAVRCAGGRNTGPSSARPIRRSLETPVKR
jgi:hypothetical protein